MHLTDRDQGVRVSDVVAYCELERVECEGRFVFHRLRIADEGRGGVGRRAESGMRRNVTF